MPCMYALVRTSIFKRDIKLCAARGYDLSELDMVVKSLLAGKQLDERYQDHPLKGSRKGQRDCHISTDWVLVYAFDEENKLLKLLRTGTHADLF